MRWKTRKYQGKGVGEGGLALAFKGNVLSSVNNPRRKSQAGPAPPGTPNGTTLNQFQSDSSSWGGR